MVSFLESSISQIGGCTVRATNKGNKTAVKIQRHAQYKNATRVSCCGFLRNKTDSIEEQQQQQQQIHSNQHVWWLLGNSNNINNIKIANCNNNKRPLTLLLVMVMTLAIIAQKQQTAEAAAVISSESPSSESSSSESSSSESSELSLSPLSQKEVAAAAMIINELSHLHAGNTRNMRRTRLRKRHSNYLFFHNNLHESSTVLEWENPCGGIYEPVQRDENAEESIDNGSNSSGMRVMLTRYYMKLLRRSTDLEYRTLNSTQHVIDISDIATWRLHKDQYKFLPNLKKNSNVALRRWYRNMQIYIAAFAHLGRTQYKYDRVKLMKASKTSEELNDLLLSARRILCEIETAFNGSYPRNAHNKLITISREAMNKRLNFLTGTQHPHTHPSHTHIEAVNAIDLKFTKYSYYDFLLTMRKILRKNTLRKGQQAAHDVAHMDHSSRSAESDNASMSLRALNDLSASSSSGSSESFEIFEDSLSHSRSASRGRKRNVRRRQQQHRSADLPQLNEV